MCRVKAEGTQRGNSEAIHFGKKKQSIFCKGEIQKHLYSTGPVLRLKTSKVNLKEQQAIQKTNGI